VSKWDDPSFPKTGWVCLSVKDLGPDKIQPQACDVCETIIRYVHTMFHEDRNLTLDCGCVCDGHMTGDEEAAKQRDTDCQRKTEAKLRQRRQWLDDDWWVSKFNSSDICKRTPQGFVTVYRRNGIFSAGFRGTYSDWYTEQEEAKEAAFTLVHGGTL
jgi:hypothetical protein